MKHRFAKLVALRVILLVGLFQVAWCASAVSVPTIYFRVLHVCDSPRMWSGIAEFDQFIDVIVLRTTSGGFTEGQKLTFGVPLVYPSDLFDHKNRELLPSKIAPGKKFVVHDRGLCFWKKERPAVFFDNSIERRIDGGWFSLDPSCIEPLSK